MERCEHCQNLMLEYLYDLLEGPERQALLEHLDQCATCRAALDQAKAQQSLLAAAAKKQFAEVRFEAPRAAAPQPAAPVVLPLPRRRVRDLARWAVAAAVLVAATGLALPGARHWQDYSTARATVDGHQLALAQSGRNINETRRQIEQAPTKEREKLAAVVEQIRDKGIKIAVIAPASVQSGAHNEFRFQAKNLNDKTVPARLDVVIRDQDKRVVFEEKDIAFEGDHRLALPRDLAVTPNTRLALEVTARREGGLPSELREELQLVPPLYLTHLTTDKPMYQPGETVRFRSLTLERFSLKPAEEPFQLEYRVTLPTGNDVIAGGGDTQRLWHEGHQPVLGPDGKPVRGIGTGEYVIDPGAKGGEYILTVRELNGRFLPQQRKFIVNQYQPPRMIKQLDFARKSYGPGEEVVAVCKADYADAGPVANRPVEATVTIDDKTISADGKESSQPIRAQTDDQGRVEVRFRLPAVIDKGEASLSVKFNDGALPEPITRTVPIVLKKLHVEFFPEGGDLVAGVPNRVYFQVKSTLGKPADLRGRIVDEDGTVAANVETLADKDHPGVNQGQGLFTFTPQAGRRYELKIESPAGVEGRHVLPPIQRDGVVLSIPGGVVRADEPIRVVIHNAGQDRSLLVGGYCRGRLLDHQTVTVKKGDQPTDVILRPTQSVGGVYRVTVFEERPGPGQRREFVPLAERLVYRKPLQRLELALHANQKHYVPGGKVSLSVTGVTEDDVPAPAIVMLAVVDKSVLGLADEKTRRTMPTHFYMTTEVRKPDDLEYADFLLTTHPRAVEALDLLLGTQGWRRFAEQNPQEFRDKFKDEAERLLVSTGLYPPEVPWVKEGQMTPETQAFKKTEETKARDEIQNELKELREQLNQERRALAAAQQDETYLAAAAVVSKYQKAGGALRTASAALVALLLLVATVAFLVMALLRSGPRAAVAYMASGICALLFLSLIAFQLSGNREVQLARGAAPLATKGEEADLQNEHWRGGDRLEVGEALLAERAGENKPADGGPPRAPDPAMPLAEPGVALPPADRPGAGKEGGEHLKRLEDQLERANRLPMLGRATGDAKMRERRNVEEMEKDIGGKGDARRELLDGKDKGLFDPARRPRPLAPGGEFGQGLAMGGRGPVTPFVVRQFAYTHKPSKAGERSDFAETVYWHPVLVMPGGRAEVQFDLSDSVTTFEALAYGHTLDGRLGAVTTTIQSRLPFSLEPKVPIEVTASDKIDIPVSIANNTAEKRDVNIRLEHPGLKLLTGKDQDRLTLQAEERTRRVFRLQPSLIEGPAGVLLEGKTEPFAADKVRRGFQVVPEGFPVAGSRSDMLEGVAVNDITLPDTWVPGTLKVGVQVYPSTLASLQKGLESLLREPHGCFEQTSTSNYPNLLILDYLKENDVARPDVDRRARELLGKGYQKLTSFECRNTAKNKKEGYEWFGGTAPAHEALTAYGLLQFRDMARVHDVDMAMVERTRQYLMSQRDGQGGFKRNPRALDTFGRAPEHITNAYIVWALTESGKDDDLEKELTALAGQAKTSKDPYFVSLVANSLLNRPLTLPSPPGGEGRVRGEDEAVALLKAVAALQKPEGHLDAEKTSITGSGGKSLQIETTALAVLGWLKANRPADFNVNVQNAVKWIGQQRGGAGSFGSTQSTILALKALIAHTRASKRPAEPGELKLFAGEQEVAKLAFGTDAQDVLTLVLPEAEKHLKAGKNTLRVEMTGKNVWPYTLAWSCQTLKPASAEGCAVRLATRLSRTTAGEADAVRLTVTLENVSGKGQGMAVAIIGLPAGLTVPESLKQLKDHCLLRDNDTQPGLISAFEVRGRELVLYWRDLAPDQKIEVPVDLECRVPGEYRGPASRAYLYYNPDVKHWVDPLQMTIRAAAE